MPADRAPGVLVSFVDPPPALQPTRVDVPAFVCLTERGPVDTPVRCGSWTAFRQVFGGVVPNLLGACAVKGFFDGGGALAWVVRAAAPERATTTSEAQPLDRGASVLASVNGFVRGAAATVRQGGAVHSYLVTAVDAAAGRVTWDRPLHPSLDLALAVDVATGRGTASVTLRDAGGAPALLVHASGPGSWAGRVELALSPVQRASTTSRPDGVPGPTATAVAATTGFRAGERCRVRQDVGGVVTEAEAVVDHVDAAARALRWTSPLPPAIDLAEPFTVESVGFALAVIEGGVTVEVWPDLSLLPGHPAHAPGVLTASSRVRAVALGASDPAGVRVRLAGGRDGTAALRTADLVGDELLEDGVGLAALLTVDEPAVVAAPDLVAAPTLARVTLPLPQTDPCEPCADTPEAPPVPLDATVVEAGPSFSWEQVVAAQQQLVESCAANTERIALLDPPHSCRSLADLRRWAARFSSSYAVTLAPALLVIDPADSARLRPVPGCGHLAGLLAAQDAAAGPWLSPANRTLPWAHGLTLTLSDAEHAVANDAGINLVRPLPGRGLVPMGARTCSPDTLWTFVAVRRTMIMLRRTLRHHLAWIAFEPLTPGLATVLTSAVTTLLTDVWEAGGLAGDRPEDAFAVHVDLARAAVGQLLLLVGVALARPCEFVLVTVSRTDNRLELQEEPLLVLPGVAS